MKAMASVFGLFTVLTAGASSAFAATGAREDNSGIVVWAFLGLCALIVVAQLVPAILVGFGLIKGIAQKNEEALEESR